MTQIPHKIVLKSTTKISLNDRFSTIQVSRPQNPPPVQQVRVNMAAVQQASAKNRRLAQQMGNRPNVQAALRLKKKSLKQRLGTDVRSRLSLQGNGQQQIARRTPRGGRGVRSRGRGLVRGVEFFGSAMSINSMASNASGRGRGAGAFRARGQTVAYQPRGHNVTQARGRGMSRGARRGTPGTVRGYRGGVRGRGRVMMRASPQWVRGAGGRGARRGMQGSRGQTRGQTRGRGRGRGVRGGRGGRGGNPNVTREQLDDQLEEYMCRTKGHLDSELDDYMIGSNM